MSPRKVRLVLDLVRGKYVDDAVAILRGTPNRAARVVEKLVRSASANAENNMGLHRDGLKVGGCFADGGPTLKRIQPRAMGRAYRVIKRTSHVTVIVEEAEVRQARRLARTVTKSDSTRRRRSRAAEQAAPAVAEEQQAASPVTAEEQAVAEPTVETASASAESVSEEPEAAPDSVAEVEEATASQASDDSAPEISEDSEESAPEESK